MLISVSVNYFSLIYLGITASNPAFACLYPGKTIYAMSYETLLNYTEHLPVTYSAMLISVSVSYSFLIYLGITVSNPAFAYLYPRKTTNLD